MNGIQYLILVLLIFGCSHNPGKTLEEKIDFVVKRAIEEGDFIGNILVANQGKIVYQSSSGMANSENGTAINDSTKFLIASVSKPLTAILILKLAEQGKIGLKDEIGRYFNSVRNHRVGKVTIHQLLTHTSGIKELISETHRFDENDLISADFNFEPGSDFEYSSTGYVILKEIAEISSGAEFDDLIEDEVFSPLEMKSSGVARNLEVINNMAVGYKTTEQIQLAEIGYTLEIVDGAGSLYSTTMDLFKLDRTLYSEELLSKASIKLMLNQHVKEKFGYGWFLRERGGVWDVSYHEGNLPGYSSFFSRRLSNQQAIILLANAEDLAVSDLENDIALILKKWQK